MGRAMKGEGRGVNEEFLLYWKVMILEVIPNL